MTPPDTAGIGPEDEPLGGGAGDQQEDTERGGSTGPDAAASADEANSSGGGDDHKVHQIAESEGLATRLEVEPERGDVKG